jgi:hypothetical protein
MPIETVKEGGPLSNAEWRRITPPYGQAEADAIQQALEGAARANTFEGRVAPFKTWAIRTLERAGLPVERRMTRVSDTEQAKLTAYEAPDWFAYELLRYIEIVEDDLRTGRAELAICAATQLGRLSLAVEHKFRWEPDLKKRIEHVAKNREHGRKAHGGHEEQRARRATAIQVYDEACARGLGKELAKGEAVRAIGLRSTKTIERYLKQPTTK